MRACIANMRAFVIELIHINKKTAAK